jgi:hypothetical protein
MSLERPPTGTSRRATRPGYLQRSYVPRATSPACLPSAARGAAADLLAPIYASCTEGFDTPDLKEAKALLDELGAA